ncbi:MAG: hypothetical protein ABW137_33665 [Mycobacterium sp.]
MASRVCIAAAACVVASGLFVASAGATLAFAEPDVGHVGDNDGAQVDGPGGTAVGPTSKASRGGSATGNRPTGPVMVGGTGPRHPPRQGDDRGGTSPGGGATGSASPSPSKQSEPSSTSIPQTVSTTPGEWGPTATTRTAEPDPTGTTSRTETTTGATETTTKTTETKTTETKTTEPTTKTTEPTTEPTSTTTSSTAAPSETGEPDPNDPDGDPDHEEEHPGWGWGWPWWGPCPDHGTPPVGQPPGSGSGGDSSGSPAQVPSGRPDLPPQMQLPVPPGELTPQVPGITVEPLVDAVTGLATAAAQLPFAPVTLPVIVIPGGAGIPGGGGNGAGAGGAGPRPGSPSAPRNSGPSNNAPQRAQENPPAISPNNAATPASFRVGYGEYLRSAGVGQVAAVAVPGLAGILILTGAGGLLGYRQARAGHAVRANGTARFVG